MTEYLMVLTPSPFPGGTAALGWRSVSRGVETRIIPPSNLVAGDTLTVQCQFGNYTDNGVPVPASQYCPLSMGAAVSENEDEIYNAIYKELNPTFINICMKGDAPSGTDFFINASTHHQDINRGGVNASLTCDISMEYRPGVQALASLSSDTLILVYNFGDPHSSRIRIRVKE